MIVRHGVGETLQQMLEASRALTTERTGCGGPEQMTAPPLIDSVQELRAGEKLTV